MDYGHFIGLCLGERDDPLPLCQIEERVALALGASSRRVLLSAYTVLKQRRHHPELAPDDYRVLPAALRLGEYRRQTERKAVVLFIDVANLDYGVRLAIKATSCGREIYLESFHRLSVSRYARELGKQGEVLRSHDDLFNG